MNAPDAQPTTAQPRVHTALSSTFATMVTKIWILLFLAKASLGIQIYLSPALKVRPLSSTISPTQARVVVSHQLGLDAFDSLEEMDPSTERLVSGDFIGEGVKNALLLTVSEDVARGAHCVTDIFSQLTQLCHYYRCCSNLVQACFQTLKPSCSCA